MDCWQEEEIRPHFLHLPVFLHYQIAYFFNIKQSKMRGANVRIPTPNMASHSRDCPDRQSAQYHKLTSQ